MPDCHEGGKTFPDPIVRQMLRALGIETCPKCFRAIRLHHKRGAIERPT